MGRTGVRVSSDWPANDGAAYFGSTEGFFFLRHKLDATRIRFSADGIVPGTPPCLCVLTLRAVLLHTGIILQPCCACECCLLHEHRVHGYVPARRHHGAYRPVYVSWLKGLEGREKGEGGGRVWYHVWWRSSMLVAPPIAFGGFYTREKRIVGT